MHFILFFNSLPFLLPLKKKGCIGSQTMSWLSCWLNWGQVGHLMGSKD
jgi:hypothetical protein